ncbi:alcohol dehydrogenase catalytic domain-containing protein [Patescibacteria group bacterium AH-259-L05]|nr:alcohol dehydrogenase catalytic domain-containing protein [Patescibacteria group bacterium AH-259-L05]
MKAAIFKGQGKLVVEDVPEPKLEDITMPLKYTDSSVIFRKDDLVKLKILAASICGTDIHILHVPQGHPSAKNIILGHEYVGEVVEIGKNVKNIKVGDRVAVDPNIKCGYCWPCQNDHASLCQNMTTLGIFADGGFAEYNVAPAKQFFATPQDLDIEKAIFFEPLTCSTHCWNKIEPRVGDTILIFGSGPMGCYFIELARLTGLNTIIVSEPQPFRRGFAEKLGATVVNPLKKNLKQVIMKLTGHGVDIAIDACGIPEVIKDAMDLVRPGGKIATFGEQNIHAFADQVSFTKVTQKELQLIGSYATTRSFDQTIKILERDDIRLKELITHRISLDEIHKGIELMKKGKAVEIIIYPNQ